jgi:hypothetical protein
MFGLLSKKSGQDQALRLVGIDLNATRLRAVVAGEGRTRAILLDDAGEELPLFLNLDGRIAAGAEAVAAYRLTPHLICSNFLGLLGTPHEWRAGRRSLTPETATHLTFEKLLKPIVDETDSAGLSLPAYLSTAQVRTVLEIANAAKLPLRGSASAPLALASHRAGTLQGPATLLHVDVDEYALTGTVLEIGSADVRVVETAHWPQASLRNWKNRLLDGMADHCVRICRRDPRDSAEAEQGMYDQLDLLLEQTRTAQRATMQIRGEHWFQDLAHAPEQVEGYCTALVNTSAEGLQQLLQSSALKAPPTAVWFSHAAGRLPGLAAKIYKHSPEQTTVSILPQNAAAEAVAAILPRWLQGTLPRLHLDSVIPFEKLPPSAPSLPPLFIGKTPLKSPLPSGRGES